MCRPVRLPARRMVEAGAIPALRRGVRRRFDEARGQAMLLGPERVVLLDEIGDAIVELCDGQRDIAAISAVLAQRYGEDAALVQEDVRGFIAALLEKGLVSI